MFSNRIPFLIFVLGFTAAALIVPPSAAQKRPADPRPLQGLDRGSIPAYSSVEAFLAAHPRTDLRAAATPVGTSDRTVRRLAPPLVVGKASTAMTSAATTLAGAFGDIRIQRAPNGTVRWMAGDLAAADASLAVLHKSASAAAYETAALNTARVFADLLALADPQQELRPMGTRADELGYVHARFEQVYDGVPIWGSDLYVHFGDDGTPYAVNGTYEPTPSRISTTPGLSAADARGTVVSDLAAKGRWAPATGETARLLGLDRTETRLVLYPDADEGMRLAYEVSLHPNLVEWYSYLVDAQTSEILHSLRRHCSVLPDDGTLPPPDALSYALPSDPATAASIPTRAFDATRIPDLGTARISPRALATAEISPSALATAKSAAGAFVDANGTALDGAARNFRVYRNEDGGHHMIWDLPNLDPNAFQFPEFGQGGILTFSAGNTDGDQEGQITTVISTDNSWTDPVSVSAHENARILYDYYKNTFDRNAIDGKDASVLSVVHITSGGQPMDNAYWNGRFMAYGDGDQAFEPLAGAMDVAAHEMTHGVVEHSAALVYQFQPGALNESFADVFGVMLDREDLLLGEDIARPNFGPALRDMLNPDSPQLSQPQPAHMNAYRNLTIEQDNGGVHINSGIPNRAAALLIQALGHDKVQEIYYRALTSYLTRNSQFGDARNAVEQSARDLFGEGSTEVAAVQQAFDAVGINATTGTGGEGGNDLPPVTGGQSMITFLLEDGSIGVLDVTNPGDLQLGVFENARARSDAALHNFAQLTAPRGGERIWYVNPEGLLAYVDVQSGEVSVFTDLWIAEEGDLWNASVSPDESLVAIVSAYSNDPTLYIFNGEQIGAVPLTPETSQDGIQTQTIRFPDVVSWSPNPQIPRIAFDAYNELDLDAGSVGFWGIYEIDFAADRIYNLMPAQPAGYSVGNIAYSNTDPDIVAFNAIDASGTFDLVLGNFAEGQIYPLELPAMTFDGGAQLLDAQRPTFSPDNAMLAFTSPSNGVLGFVDFAAEDVTFLDLQASVFNPHWFALGGSGGSQNQAPTASFTLNTTAGNAPLPIAVDASASADPDGNPLTYRWDFGDGTIGSGATAVHTYQQTGSFTLTLTVTDGGGLSGTATARVDVSASSVSADAGAELPRAVALHQNHPNPFNPSTLLSFDLPAAMDVEITVYDLLGRPVSRLLSRPMQAGSHEIHFDAADLPSGAYLARLRAGNTVQIRTMLLLR